MDSETKVLVTGASGFIGSHLAEQLISKYKFNKVSALIRYNSRSDYGLIERIPKEIRQNIEIAFGDLRDPFAVRKAAKDIDIIYHLGAYSSIPYSYVNPKEVIESNVIGTTNILDAALENTSTVINISSSEVYGTAQYIPIDEKHPLVPQSPYSASKIAAENITKSYYYTFELPVVIIRPFNTYGARQFARDVIPSIISQALINRTIKLGRNTTSKRDFTYITDTVDGIVKASKEKNMLNAMTINIGSGHDITINELVCLIGDILNKDIIINYDEKRTRPEKSEVRRLLCDNTLAKTMLSWSPKISLNNGLKLTCDYIKENQNLYKSDTYNIWKQ